MIEGVQERIEGAVAPASQLGRPLQDFQEVLDHRLIEEIRFFQIAEAPIAVGPVQHGRPHQVVPV